MGAGRLTVAGSSFTPSRMEKPHCAFSTLIAIASQITDIPGSAGMFSPRWSPDGRFIAALSTHVGVLKVCDLETHRWSTILSHEGIGFPSWSRDSRYLYIIYYD